MESLGYVLIYLLRGFLPWQGLKVNSEQQKDKLILEKKQAAEDSGLFESVPVEFQAYFEHLRLGSPTSVDYSYLRRLFRNLFRRSGYEYDFVFDWTELKFLEALNEAEGGRMKTEAEAKDQVVNIRMRKDLPGKALASNELNEISSLYNYGCQY
jgi:hypothetical protein